MISLSHCKSIVLCLAANIHLSLALSNSRSHSSFVSDTLGPCFLLVLVLSPKHPRQSLFQFQSLTCLCSFCLPSYLSLSLSKSRSQSNNYLPPSECTILSRRSCAESISSERVVAREFHSFANLFLPCDIFSSVPSSIPFSVQFSIVQYSVQNSVSVWFHSF